MIFTNTTGMSHLKIFLDCCSLEYATHTLSQKSVRNYHCTLRKPRGAQISKDLLFYKWWREEEPAVLYILERMWLKVKLSGKNSKAKYI
jgi:hypothetical protein